MEKEGLDGKEERNGRMVVLKHKDNIVHVNAMAGVDDEAGLSRETPESKEQYPCSNPSFSRPGQNNTRHLT